MIESESAGSRAGRGVPAKVLAIVGFCAEEVAVYAEQLLSLFGDAVEIRRRIAGLDSPGADADADLVLFPSWDAYELWAAGKGREGARAKAAPKDSFVFAGRTLSLEGLERVMAIAPGSQAYVLDRTRGMADQMAAVLLHLGLRGVKLVPLAFSEVAGFLPSSTAVVLGDPGSAPSSATAICDAGRCLLDVGSVIDLGMRLDLFHMLNRQNIRESYRELAVVNLGLAEILGKTNRGEAALDILLRSVEAGVVAVNAKGEIFACNEKAGSLAGLPAERLIGGVGADSFPELPFAAALEGKVPIKDTLGRVGGRVMARAVEPIIHSGVLYGAVAVFDVPGPEEGRLRPPRRGLIDSGYRARHVFADIAGSSGAISRCRDIARRMAASSSSILISGESGTGKEMFAQAIHNASPRRGFPFVAVNCGALPASLLESELFGYEEGAFTGARKGGKPGLLELAHRGTLLLDEVGETPLELQLRLLRVLEQREIMRLGSDRLIGIDIRLIAATNKDLEDLVAAGRFREDLYYRLAVLPLRIPPLRERREDIGELVREFQRIQGRSFELSPEAEKLFLSHPWRGNCRELRNYIEFIANLGVARAEAADLPFGPARRGTRDAGIPPAAATGRSPQDIEYGSRRFLLAELESAYASGLRCGRRSLSRRARERGLFLGEQEIRSLLLGLKAEGLVRILPGKSGTLITNEGRAELARLIGI